jgi:hypothetical protein
MESVGIVSFVLIVCALRVQAGGRFDGARDHRVLRRIETGSSSSVTN